MSDKIYAVKIGTRKEKFDPITHYNSATFKCKSKTEARACGKLYIRQWQLTNNEILEIKEITKEELQKIRGTV